MLVSLVDEGKRVEHLAAAFTATHWNHGLD